MATGRRSHPCGHLSQPVVEADPNGSAVTIATADRKQIFVPFQLPVTPLPLLPQPPALEECRRRRRTPGAATPLSG